MFALRDPGASPPAEAPGLLSRGPALPRGGRTGGRPLERKAPGRPKVQSSNGYRPGRRAAGTPGSAARAVNPFTVPAMAADTRTLAV